MIMDMSYPKLTVALLSWNRKEAIREALHSVRKQTLWSEIETLVVDSGSKDGTPEMIRREFPWVRLEVLQQNLGLAEGRNITVRKALSDIVFWLDDDATIVEETALEKVLQVLDHNPRIAVVYCKIIEETTGHIHVYVPERYVDEKSDIFESTLWTYNFSSGATAIRKSAFLECEGYDKDFFRMGVENDLSFRLYDKGYQIVYYPECSVIHKPASYGRNRKVIAYYSLRNRMLGEWKHYPTCLLIPAFAMDVAFNFSRSVLDKTFLSFTNSVIDFAKMAVCKKRTPISDEAFKQWGFAKHHVVTDPSVFGHIKYSKVKFLRDEISIRLQEAWNKLLNREWS